MTKENKDVLVLDGSNYAIYSIDLLDKILGKEVKLVDRFYEATDELDTNKYGVVLTEPMMCFTRIHMREEYRNFLADIRTNRNIPVVLYSTQDKGTIDNDWGLVQGTHYDSYICKQVGASKLLKETLEKLL